MQGKWKWVLLISFLSTYVNFSVFNLGLSLVPGSLGSMIIGVSPAFTSLAAVLILKEKMTRKKTACLCLGMTGVVLLALSRSPWNSTGLSEILGIVLLLCSNSANAVSTSIMKKHFSKDEVMPLTLVHTSIGAVAVCLTAFALENPDYSQFYNPDAFGSIFCLAIITAGATTIWNALLCQRGVHVTDLAIWRFLIPSAGAALSWLFLPNDNPSFVMICCLVLITSSILLSVIEFPRCELICKSKGVAIGDNK